MLPGVGTLDFLHLPGSADGEGTIVCQQREMNTADYPYCKMYCLGVGLFAMFMSGDEYR